MRRYGKGPIRVAVVHGGPGAPGSVAAVARELSKNCGVVEPIQTKSTLEGQVLELYQTITNHCELPVVLIGHSWGAWLSYFVAALYPQTVSKLVLVSSGAFEAKYVRQLSEARLSRLEPDERVEFDQLLRDLHSGETQDRSQLMSRLGALVSKTDNFSPIDIETDAQDSIEAQGDTYQSVWLEAAELRKTGALLEYAKNIRCPALAIHGDYDPSPADGVREPLMRLIPPLEFALLGKCGHSPWKERFARDEFYSVLRDFIARQ